MTHHNITHHNDLTARRAAARQKTLLARLIAYFVLLSAALIADALGNGALDMAWFWGGLTGLLAAYHTLAFIAGRALAGWERRTIRRMVNAPGKRDVVAFDAINANLDRAPEVSPAWWLDDHEQAPRRQFTAS